MQARFRLGAVTYLNARPLVYGLESRPERFDVRYDMPSECARLLHARETDLGLIPSIEYLRGPAPTGSCRTSAVMSRRPRGVGRALHARPLTGTSGRSAMDTSSRTSVALCAILLPRAFGIDPEPAPMAPDLDAMLDGATPR